MTDKKNVTIVGGGLGGLEAALYLRKRLPREQADVVLISDRPEFVFKPYLNYVPFGLQPADLAFNLSELAKGHGFHFRQGTAHAANPETQTLRVNGASLSYDTLFVATGATAGPETVPGLHTHGYMLGRESEMRRLRKALRELCKDAKSGATSRIAFLVPPGCQWAGALYELAFMLSTWLDWKGVREHVDLMLMTPEARFMNAFGPGVHESLQQELRERGIGARRHQHPERAEKGALIFPEKGRLPFDLLIAAPASVATVRWGALPTDEQGFLRTDLASRQVEDHPSVYAVGDASDYPVKQGFLALLQADAAAEHWTARLRGDEPAFSFEPQGTWLMEQFDQALLAQGSLQTNVSATDDPTRVERLPVGQFRRILASEHLPGRAGDGAVNPLYSGLLWKGTETSLKMLKYLTERAGA